MPKEITEFQKHIRLVLDHKLEDPWPSIFWRTVERVGPDDIIHPVQIYDELGKSKTVKLRHYKDGKDHVYEVPLSRDLTEDEAEKIVWIWEQLYSDEYGDFTVETSTPYTGGHQDQGDDEIMSEEEFEEFARELAKERHKRWMKKRLDAGWQYGLKFDHKKKTHPMLRPWEQLPEEYKNVDRNYPSILANLLADFGFGIYKKKKTE